MILVHHYGLHWLEGDIAFLAQHGRADQVTGVDFPLDVKVQLPTRKLVCPHNIKLEYVEDLPLPQHPLVRAFCPSPKKVNEDVIFIDDTPHNHHLVAELSRLTSPANTLIVLPMWMYSIGYISAQLQLTNIQPLVLSGYSQYMQPTLEKVVSGCGFAPRRLIVIAPKWVGLRVQNGTFIETDDLSVEELSALPLENIGAHILIERMKQPRQLQ